MFNSKDIKVMLRQLYKCRRYKTCILKKINSNYILTNKKSLFEELKLVNNEIDKINFEIRLIRILNKKR